MKTYRQARADRPGDGSNDGLTTLPRDVVRPLQEGVSSLMISAASDRVAQCESGGRWNVNTGNGYHGGLQFSQESWNAAGGSGNPANASREEQIRVAENLQGMQGWGAWPSCSSQLGLR